MSGVIGGTGGDGSGTGDGGAAGDGAAAQGGNTPGEGSTGSGGGDGGKQITIPENWKEALPEDLRNDPSMGHIQTPEALAKSYIHAQKAVGKDKFFVPDENATDDDWNEIHSKLGKPGTAKEYTFDFKTGQSLDEDMLNKSREVFHKAGLNNKQAAVITQFFIDESEAQEATTKTLSEDFEKEQVSKIKKEWGEAFEAKVNKLNIGLKHFDKSGELLAYLQDTKQTNSIPLMKFLAAVGETLDEGTIKGDAGKSGMATPDEARSKISSIYSDAAHPYMNARHPKHEEAVREMEALNKQAYPEEAV